MTAVPLPVYLIHWDAPDWVASAARSCANSDISVDLAIIDNGPREASAALDLPASARIISADSNLGYAGGANLGIRDWLAGTSEWCVIGSHDLHVKTGTFRLLVEAGQSHPLCGIIGPETATNFAGKLVDRAGVLEIREMVSGVCLLLRRSCIEQIGGFDEDFGSYGEDNELCIRARQHGWLVGLRPGAMASGLGSSAANKQRLKYRNSVLLLLKTEGRRAAARGYLRNLRYLILAASQTWLPGARGARKRSEATDRFYSAYETAPYLLGSLCNRLSTRWTPVKRWS